MKLKIAMDDLISRQAAIDAIKALWNDAPTAQHVSAMFDCEDAIRALPSAQPERKGKWIDGWRGRLDGTRYWYRECSECGYERDDDDPEKDTNYCPNCGAEMEGGRDVDPSER